jgi:spermidine synthase
MRGAEAEFGGRDAAFDPIVAAAQIPTAAQFERMALESLRRTVGYDVAFMGLPGASMTSVGLTPDLVERGTRRGSRYEGELAAVKEVALAARGVAVDTEVLGESRVRQTAYYREMARPLGGRHSLLGYLVLRGRVIGCLMLGRTGGRFREDEVARVADRLPGLAVGRASYGTPGVARAPLRPSGRPLPWPWGERVLARRVQGEMEVRVRDDRNYREMVARDLRSGREMIWTRAGLEDAARSGWPYIDLLHVAAGLAHRRERALFLGCGGAVGPRQFAVCYPGIEIDVVEPESHVIELARSFYALDEIPRLTVHRADGATFLESASRSWDIVVVDAYDGDALGMGLSGRRFFQSVRDRLCSGGTFAFNVVGALDGSGPIGSLIDAATSVFHDVRLVPVMTSTEQYAASTVRNVVVVGVCS